MGDDTRDWVETLDELIESLERYRDRMGGDTPVWPASKEWVERSKKLEVAEDTNPHDGVVIGPPSTHGGWREAIDDVE